VRWAKRSLIVILILVLGFTAFAVFTVRRSFPQIRGDLEVSGLMDEVEIPRDELGVPHIYASNRHDLFFAQGFTHAQERFWQMDFWRHIGAGRLAEMFGESQVEADMFLRSLGFEALAEKELGDLTPESREILQAYTDGINAYLDTHSSSEISLEYAILGFQNSGYEIEPWSPIDTLIWPKVMSWDLAGNLGAEIERTVLGRSLGPERVEQLFPPMPDDKPVIVETGQEAGPATATVETPDGAVEALASVGAAVDQVMEVTGGGFEGIGSNNWVVGGSMTESGLPLLANDTHLAIQMPSIWFENGLHCVGCGLDVVGFSFAGTPAVVVGHNDHHAWGVTNEAADTQDLFIERVNPDDRNQYEVNGEWVDFETRTETIVVAGAEDVTFDVHSTRHGPVISGTYLEDGEFDDSSVTDVPDDYVVALAWKTLEPSTIVDAIVGINLATSYEEFSDAAASWDIAPQNLVYADVEGNIAYFATGEIPMRAAGDGLYPVPGWTSEYDWTGVVPHEEMPRMLNPPQGYIESANQRVLREGRTPFIGRDSAHGYRAERIVEMLESTDSHDIASMQEMQMDTRDGSAVAIVPYLLSVDPGGDTAVADIQEWLEGWSTGASAYQVSGGSTGAAVYMAVWRHLLANVFHDELPEENWPTGGGRWFEVVKSLLKTPEDRWWDDIETPETETMDQVLLASMRDAHAELVELLGDDPGGWSWGDLHIANFENQSLGKSGISAVEWLFNRTAPSRVGGSTSIVDAVGWDADKSYLVDWVPSERMVVDLSDLGSSTFVHTTGQSGHAFHQNYDSMIEMWTDGDHGPMPWTRDQVESLAVDVLTLVPSG
jgi:penicillin amidase